VTYRVPARTAGRRRTRSDILAALALISAALVGVLGYQSSAVSSPSATSPLTAVPLAHRPQDSLPGGDHGAPDEADGVVPDGVTVFDGTYPAVANLDPALLRALRQAATDAAGHRVEIYVESGWRSPQYQEQLLDEAISKYGSKEQAARWVATPATSAHVSGHAVDIGHFDATSWLSKHGAQYGLCQIYGNEPWHYELRPEAIRRGCPPVYADPTHDPRMQH
jgi:zinc D-Ala-D-Ala carboxypeptidase